MDVLNSLSLRDLNKAISSPAKKYEEVFSRLLPGDRNRFYYPFNSGRTALYFLISSKKWRNVGVPAFTCPIIPLAVKAAGATPVYIDCQADSFNLAIDKIPAGLDALIAVHTFGYPLDMLGLRHKVGPKVALIEDLAHFLGGKTGSGTSADFQLVSLYKQLPNFGGSVLISKSPINYRVPPSGVKFSLTALLLLLAEMRLMVNLVRRISPLPVDDLRLGAPSAIPNLWWKIFQIQSGKLTGEINARRKLAAHYQQYLDQEYFFFPEDDKHLGTYPNFSVILKKGSPEKRDKLLTALRHNGIFADRLWYNSLTSADSWARTLSGRVVNLPIRAIYTHAQIHNLCGKVNNLTHQLI